MNHAEICIKQLTSAVTRKFNKGNHSQGHLRMIVVFSVAFSVPVNTG